VELTQGRARFDRERLVIDTPGVDSLVPRSEDERIARDILVEDGDQLIVQVADAKNLRRALVISSQLAEMEVPFMLDLNMWDEAQNQGIKVDTERLAQLLRVPVIRTVAIRHSGHSAPGAQRTGESHWRRLQIDLQGKI
jgi:ferrous iron transport protein B